MAQRNGCPICCDPRNFDECDDDDKPFIDEAGTAWHPDCLEQVLAPLRALWNEGLAPPRRGRVMLRREEASALARRIRNVGETLAPGIADIVVVVTDTEGEWVGVAGTAPVPRTLAILAAALHAGDYRTHVDVVDTKCEEPPPFHIGQRVKVTGGPPDGGFSYIIGCEGTVVSLDDLPSIKVDVDGHGEFGCPSKYLAPA